MPFLELFTKIDMVYRHLLFLYLKDIYVFVQKLLWFILDKLNDCLQNIDNVDDVIKANKGELYPRTFDDCPVYFFCISYVPVYIAIDTNAREAFTVDFEG